MPFSFKCPACTQSLKGTLTRVGKELSCPKCGKPIVVPYPPEDPPPVCELCGEEEPLRLNLNYRASLVEFHNEGLEILQPSICPECGIDYLTGRRIAIYMMLCGLVSIFIGLACWAVFMFHGNTMLGVFSWIAIIVVGCLSGWVLAALGSRNLKRRLETTPDEVIQYLESDGVATGQMLGGIVYWHQWSKDVWERKTLRGYEAGMIRAFTPDVLLLERTQLFLSYCLETEELHFARLLTTPETHLLLPLIFLWRRTANSNPAVREVAVRSMGEYCKTVSTLLNKAMARNRLSEFGRQALRRIAPYFGSLEKNLPHCLNDEHDLVRTACTEMVSSTVSERTALSVDPELVPQSLIGSSPPPSDGNQLIKPFALIMKCFVFCPCGSFCKDYTTELNERGVLHYPGGGFLLHDVCANCHKMNPNVVGYVEAGSPNAKYEPNLVWRF